MRLHEAIAYFACTPQAEDNKRSRPRGESGKLENRVRCDNEKIFLLPDKMSLTLMVK